jgi:hypothetical protein
MPYRFKGDQLCRAEGFAAYSEALRDRFIERVLPDSAANTDTAPFFKNGVRSPHSPATAHLIDQAGQPNDRPRRRDPVVLRPAVRLACRALGLSLDRRRLCGRFWHGRPAQVQSLFVERVRSPKAMGRGSASGSSANETSQSWSGHTKQRRSSHRRRGSRGGRRRSAHFGPGQKPNRASALSDLHLDRDLVLLNRNSLAHSRVDRRAH